MIVFSPSTDRAELMVNEIRALSLHQPWASLISCGVKHIETRSWSTKYRGRILIHAAQRPPEHGLRLGDPGPIVTREFLVQYPATPSARSTPRLLDLCNEESHALPLGKVVASAVLADCVPMERASLCIDVGPRGWAIQSLGDVLLVDPDQLPFGDFTPGRWAWLLEAVEPDLERILVAGMREWADEHGECDTQGIMDDEWLALAAAGLAAFARDGWTVCRLEQVDCPACEGTGEIDIPGEPHLREEDCDICCGSGVLSIPTRRVDDAQETR